MNELELQQLIEEMTTAVKHNADLSVYKKKSQSRSSVNDNF